MKSQLKHTALWSENIISWVLLGFNNIFKTSHCLEIPFKVK